MKRDLKGYADNFLFALNIFIVFLLLFEREMVIPQWLQPLGRMHPMVLHFPIVLLLISMVLEFFRFKPAHPDLHFYNNFASILLLIAAIASGITVIMGIFLAREQGYNETVLFWHKWSGVSVFFIASVLYSCRNTRWYTPSVAKAGAIITAVSLILAGHYGASLTHGDNFVLQPVLSEAPPAPVTVQEAVLFDHVIRPVFEKKCISCHNADKRKGKLMLTDSASVLKGGKTGELFVAGQPEMSLLLKRTRLPLEDKKHMPPAGKPQLTVEERELLRQWIRRGPLFNVKVTALSESDSLRLAAIDVLAALNNSEEQYNFPAIASQALEKLNSNYRVIRPVAKNSPALTVNIYNRNAYSPETVKELKEVSLQVISLDLSKMPVKDEDLKYVARLENLERLDLNFTAITGRGLQNLRSLKNLEALSIAGTKISYQDLRDILPLFQNLKTLAVWATELSPPEITQLQEAFKHVRFLGALERADETLIKLNPPRLKNISRVFEDTISLQIYHPVKEVDIRFTIDGTDPDSVSSSLFNGKTILKDTYAIKARAYKRGWLSSDVATLNVYRSSQKPDTAILLTPLNRVHTANGANTFFDHELGSFNANSPAWANNWAGFLGNDMELMLRYDSARRIKSVSLNTLIEIETSVFPPASIEIWGGKSETDMQLLKRVTPPKPQVNRKPYIHLFDCNFDPQQVSTLKIVAKPVMKLPAWHKNKNKRAYLLIDEILIN